LDKKGHEKDNRVYTDLGKSPTILTHGGGGKHVKVLQTSERGRRLTEDGTKRDDKNGAVVRGYETRPDGKTCERLQTLPDDYTSGISNTQRYKALGNGWTVDVIAHILSFIMI